MNLIIILHCYNCLFLQVNTASNWHSTLQDLNQISQIIGTILVVIYVIVTFKTFRQIKKQTDYQQDAYLSIESTIISESPDDQNNLVSESRLSRLSNSKKTNFNYINNDLSIQMQDILQPIFKFEDSLFEGNFYTLIFTNYGKAEVKKIEINLYVHIENSKELVDQKMLRQMENKKIQFQIEELISRDGGRLKIALISTASFPIYKIHISGSYQDIRNKNYKIPDMSYFGENPHLQKLNLA